VSVDTVHLPPRAERSIVLRAWSPYILLVIFVLLWELHAVQGPARQGHDRDSPGRVSTAQSNGCRPWFAKAAPYPAKFTFNILSASGTSALFATVCAGWCCVCPSASGLPRLHAQRAS